MTQRSVFTMFASTLSIVFSATYAEDKIQNTATNTFVWATTPESVAFAPHLNKCVSETDCITFLYQYGKFNFLPVEAQETK